MSAKAFALRVVVLLAMSLSVVGCATGETGERMLVRFDMGGKGEQVDLNVKLKIENAKIARLTDYFFEAGEDKLNARTHSWICKTDSIPGQSAPMSGRSVDVVLVEFAELKDSSRLLAEVNGQQWSFDILGLKTRDQESKSLGSVYLSANWLPQDLEIGQIKAGEVGIKAGDDFDFVIFSDTHAGEGNHEVNEYLARCVEMVNKLQTRPAFVLINGDATTGQGTDEDFQALLNATKKCEVPVLLEVGNHETPYKSDFSPGYRLEPLDRFFETQSKINGVDNLILYSFDLGKWHFVVCPDPLRNHFWETHPHYFEWLDRNLKKNKDRPTIIFHHIHPLPIGINPMTNYVNSTQTRNKMLSIFTKFGNVKYVFTGHTHIPLKASFKTARTYKGTKFINLPATSNPARNFGESDFGNEGSRGFAIVSIRGNKAQVNYKMLNGDVYGFPESFAEFIPAEHPIWMMDEWELPANDRLTNGGFEDGLADWAKQYMYPEDENPSNIRQVNSVLKHNGDHSLHMFCRRRGYYVPGDNRMTQTLNCLQQAVKLSENARPLVKASYLLDGDNYTEGDQSGACIRVEGYKGSNRKMRLCYWIGRGYFKPRGLWNQWQDYYHFDITASPDNWHDVALNIEKDFNAVTKTEKYADLELDKLMVILQVWNLNQHNEADQDKPMRIGVYFDDIDIDFDGTGSASMVDGEIVEVKPEDEIESRWLMGGMGNERK